VKVELEAIEVVLEAISKAGTGRERKSRLRSIGGPAEFYLDASTCSKKSDKSAKSSDEMVKFLGEVGEGLSAIVSLEDGLARKRLGRVAEPD